MKSSLCFLILFESFNSVFKNWLYISVCFSQICWERNENLHILYSTNSYFEWSEEENCFWRFKFIVTVWIFNFLTNCLLNCKELLNLQTPNPRKEASLLTTEQVMGKWLDNREFRILGFSCKLLDSNILPMNCFCRSIDSFLWGLSTFQISRTLKVYLKKRTPPKYSKFLLKIKLKSPVQITCENHLFIMKILKIFQQIM